MADLIERADAINAIRYVTDSPNYSKTLGELLCIPSVEQTEPLKIELTAKDLQDWKDRMWAEAVVTEPTTQTETQNSNKNSNVISVYDGVSEAVRCAMCNNPNKSDRGCDGACSYDEALYKKIIDAIHNCQYEPKDESQTERKER